MSTADAFPAAALARAYAAALAANPGLGVAIDEATFARELARRLGDAANAETLARTRIDHVYLAIACGAGSARAAERVEREFFGEVLASARRMRATDDQAAEVRAQVGRLLFTSEPGRTAGLDAYSGRGDLGTYVRVIATRELVRAIAKGRREVLVDDPALLDRLSPASDPVVRVIREKYKEDVSAAVRAALAALPDEPRALLRYSVIDGWSIDRIAALYGVHRATAARRVEAARDLLGDAIRDELSTRLAISADEVDSVVRMVGSRIDVSLSRLL